MPKKPKGIDTHHLCWYRKAWSSKSYGDQVRNHWYMKVEIPRDGLHTYIHNTIPFIPVPSVKVLKKVYATLQDLDSVGALYRTDDIETRLQMAIYLFEEAPKTRKALKRQLSLVRNYQTRPP